MNEAFFLAFIVLAFFIGKVAYRAGFDAARKEQAPRRVQATHVHRIHL